MELSTQTVETIKDIAGSMPDPKAATLAALQMAQNELGFVSDRAIEQIAEILKVDPGFVEGVATFYTLIYRQPKGKHIIYICKNISCMLNGADALIQYTLDKLGLKKPGDTTDDGLFTVEAVECLGCCEHAPVARVERRFHYRLTTVAIDELIEELRKR